MKILLNQLECTIAIIPDALTNPKGANDLTSHIRGIRKEYSSVVVIADSTTYKLYGNVTKQQLALLNIPSFEIIIPDGEKSKTLASAESCWTQMMEFGMDKNSLIVALGGGVVTDLAGYVASCYLRGIDFVCVPTTLVAMIDASIGGRTAVNLPSNKNAVIGTIHHPKLVLIDSKVLNSLPVPHLQNGLVQAIRYAVISDIELFVLLEKSAKEILKGKLNLLNPIIEKACTIKADIVRLSIRQQDVREMLDWGAGFGNAVKTAAAGNCTHGEATSIGMCCEAHLSYQMGTTDQAFVERQESLCEAYALPTVLPPSISADLLLKAFPTTKKGSGKHTFILASKIGKVAKYSHVTNEDIAKILNKKGAGGQQPSPRRQIHTRG